MSYRRALMGVMAFFFVFWFVVPLVFPLATRPIYMITLPFRYIGVLVHEMGHGLGTMLTGGRFLWFQMDLGQGGVAITSGGWRVATLLGGLLGPAMVGAILLQLSTRVKQPSGVLVAVGVFFLLAIYYILKPLVFIDGDTLSQFHWSMGKLVALIVPIGALVCIWFLLKMHPSFQRLSLQVFGVVMCYAAYSDTQYIFRYAPLPNGMFSDSRELAGLFWLSAEAVPRWLFWLVAISISLVNFGLMLWGVWRALQAEEHTEVPRIPGGISP